MKFLLGTKIGMSQVWSDDGVMLPITLILAGPVRVTQVKGKEKDGYTAVQVGFGNVAHPKKPQAGHLGTHGNLRWLREYRGEPGEELAAAGESADVTVFSPGDKVRISGVSKGKGFQGVVKRHHFRGHPSTHGTKHATRQPGSIGATSPQRVRKGQRMAGRMGHERVTVKNVEVVKVDKDQNLLAVKGAVPGARGTLLEIRG